MFRMLFAAWITGWVVATASSVGETYSSGIYGIGLPINVFILLLVTAVLAAAAWEELNS